MALDGKPTFGIATKYFPQFSGVDSRARCCETLAVTASSGFEQHAVPRQQTSFGGAIEPRTNAEEVGASLSTEQQDEEPSQFGISPILK